MSKEQMISFPKKKVLEEDDFDFQIKSQEGTKVIKLSNFNETELGGEGKEYSAKVSKENQDLVDFLEAGPPRPAFEKNQSPTKKPLFGWKRKPSKKEEDEFRGNSPTKAQPMKVQAPQPQPQVMPQSMPPKPQAQRTSSAPKALQSQSPQQYPVNSNSVPDTAALEQSLIPPSNMADVISTETKALPVAEDQQVPADDAQVDPYEEEAQLYAIDPVLMKNTDFNAAFIHVDDLGKAKPKNTTKGVKFAAAVDTIIDYSSDDEDGGYQAKPTFAPRGSSMKNLDGSRQSVPNEPVFPSRTVSAEASRQQNDQNLQDGRPKSRPVSTIEPEMIQESRQSSVPKQVIRSRSFDEGVYPSQHPSQMPALPVNSKVAFPAPPQQRLLDSQPRKFSDAYAQPVRKMSDTSIPFSRKMSDNLIPYNRKVSDASRTSDITDRYLPSPMSTSDKSLQTEKDDRENLLSMISNLQAQLQASQEENARQQALMQDQKKGFDKLSAQAYKKIKELLTDRNIMTIELKSLRSQIEKMEVQYDEWTVDTEE